MPSSGVGKGRGKGGLWQREDNNNNNTSDALTHSITAIGGDYEVP